VTASAGGGRFRLVDADERRAGQPASKRRQEQTVAAADVGDRARRQQLCDDPSRPAGFLSSAMYTP
jgi:hypothetical protein